MKRFSILLRVVLLSVVLLTVLVGSMTYLDRQISDNKSIMLEQVELLSTVTTAQAASKAFGDLKYWLTDLAVSLLMQSERKSEGARTELLRILQSLEKHNPKAVVQIRRHVDMLMKKAFSAVDAYSNNERVLGNSLMATSRIHIRGAEKEFSGLVARLQAEAIAKRDMAFRQSQSTHELSIAVMVLAGLFGFTLTFFVIASIRDTLTERDRLARENEHTREALIDREMRLDSVLTTVADAIVTIDDQGRVLTFNRAATRIFGYAESEAVGGNIKVMLRREDRNFIDDSIENLTVITPPHSSIRRAEIVGQHKTGREFPIHIALSEMEVDGDKMFAGILRDVTDINQREKDLLNAKDEADLANRAKTEFLANMSHELRTPLNAVIGFAEIMKMEAFGPIGSPRYREYVEDIRASGKHLLQVINDILDMSKIETGEMTLDDGDVEIPGVISSCFRLVDERASRGGVNLSSNGLENLPLLRADMRMFKQIVLNLLSNAVKFTEDGGRVSVGGEITAEGELCVFISDTGIGIATEDLENVYAPFRQVDNSLQRKFEGTGLGLPLVKSMMELHGGRIELESTFQVGTTAMIIFPAERVIDDMSEPRRIEAAPH
jgi:PAS domain S-box-containing protein